MGLYDDQQCKDIINEKSPWEVVKGPNEEVAISSRYAVFYRNGSLDEVQATNSFGDRGSVIDLFPTCHWIFNIPEGNKFDRLPYLSNAFQTDMLSTFSFNKNLQVYHVPEESLRNRDVKTSKAQIYSFLSIVPSYH